MPLDRFGHRINIGWADHEDLWIEAANTLGRSERQAAFRDIAELTGRDYACILRRASLFRAVERRLAKEAEMVRARKEWAVRTPKYLGTDFAPPDMKKLMAAR